MTRRTTICLASARGQHLSRHSALGWRNGVEKNIRDVHRAWKSSRPLIGGQRCTTPLTRTVMLLRYDLAAAIIVRRYEYSRINKNNFNGIRDFFIVHFLKHFTAIFSL